MTWRAALDSVKKERESQGREPEPSKAAPLPTAPRLCLRAQSPAWQRPADSRIPLGRPQEPGPMPKGQLCVSEVPITTPLPRGDTTRADRIFYREPQRGAAFFGSLHQNTAASSSSQDGRGLGSWTGRPPGPRLLSATSRRRYTPDLILRPLENQAGSIPTWLFDR